jgi:tetratricopeptide (TPR) repeat protein
MEDLGSAVQQYESALKLCPDSSELHAAVAFHYFLRKDYEKAEGFLKRAIELEPDYNLYRRLLDCYVVQSKKEEALRCLAKIDALRYKQLFEPGCNLTKIEKQIDVDHMLRMRLKEELNAYDEPFNLGAVCLSH